MARIPPGSPCGLRPGRDGKKLGDSPRVVGVFCFPAPKGQNEIAQGKAKRRPGYIGEWISAPLGSAPSGRDSIATFQPTGQTATPPEGGGFFDWIDGVDWIDCVESRQSGHCQRGQQRPPSIQSTRSIQSTLSKTQRARRRRLAKPPDFFHKLSFTFAAYTVGHS